MVETETAGSMTRLFGSPTVLARVVVQVELPAGISTSDHLRQVDVGAHVRFHGEASLQLQIMTDGPRRSTQDETALKHKC